MKKHAFKKQMAGAIMMIGTACLPAYAQGATPQQAQEDECSQEILLSYFPGVFVKDTLERFKVPKDQWDKIVSELLVRDKEILKSVEAKAAKMNPNPLKDPQQRQAAVKLFRETLFDNFSAVMKAHGVQDDKQIQSMLDDIQQQKAKRFAKCMQQRQAPQAMQGPSSGNQPNHRHMNRDSDDNEDDD